MPSVTAASGFEPALGMGSSVMLHGDLSVTVHRGENIPNLETLGLGLLGRGIAKLGGLAVDPYVNIKLGNVKIASTATIDGDLNPKWHEQFMFHVCHDNVQDLLFEVKDKNTAGATLLGQCKVMLPELLSAPQQTIDGAQPLFTNDNKKTKGFLFITVKYTPHDSKKSDDPVVPRVYFKPHEGNDVRFYSCAHSRPEMVPPVDITPGNPYNTHSCWSDVYTSITTAQKFVYLTGWSFHPLIPLVRDDPDPTKLRPLGELLKEASDRGCEVCILVWDDRSSLSIPGLAMLSKGLMNTNDEFTRNWFAQNAPRVRCQLVGRSGDQGNSFVEGQAAASFFSHHQKTIMCDCEAADGSGARHVMAYVGGLDLTKGRYDTPEHPLYPPDNRFEGDFRQPSYDCENGRNPKQPWQDIHCRVVGPLASDVIHNFAERWEKQVGTKAGKLSTPETLGCVYAPSAAPDAFSGQILRSIDSRSADLELGRNLFMKKGRGVDDSIYRGYIHHIRRAERYLYIENQYFLGSCFMWRQEQDSGCSHTVVAELVQKIVTKIRDGQEFTAYIVQPLFPEGDPYGGPVTAILKFQKLTMEAMYDAVDKALKAAGSDKTPQDYLQFLCLGKRVEGPMEGPNEGGKGKGGTLSHRHRRFMVYVHSKLLIVDDDVALVGSANINMRSLAGTRDTEIASVLWQPSHMRQLSPGSISLPRGKVHGFRMSLWKEHLGNVRPEMDEIMRDPGSLACSRLVQNCAKVNWDTFIDANVNANTAGHLMCYPLNVHREGGVSLEALSEHIPDFPGANLFGGQTEIPYVLTT